MSSFRPCALSGDDRVSVALRFGPRRFVALLVVVTVFVVTAARFVPLTATSVVSGHGGGSATAVNIGADPSRCAVLSSTPARPDTRQHRVVAQAPTAAVSTSGPEKFTVSDTETLRARVTSVAVIGVPGRTIGVPACRASFALLGAVCSSRAPPVALALH